MQQNDNEGINGLKIVQSEFVSVAVNCARSDPVCLCFTGLTGISSKFSSPVTTSSHGGRPEGPCN